MDKLIPLIKLEKFEVDMGVLRASSDGYKITTNEMEVTNAELEELHHSIDIKEEEDPNLEYQEDSHEDTLHSNSRSQIEREETKFKLEDSVNIQGESSVQSGVKLWTCQICGYKSTLKYNLTRHLKTHQGQKPFNCEICDYKCARMDYLKIHLITHTGEKSFKCEICDLKFSRKEHLKSHLKTHLGSHPGEKSFKCEICDYKCVRMDYLKNHLKIHSGEKPFMCEICDYKCVQKGTLNKHLKTHTGDKRSRKSQKYSSFEAARREKGKKAAVTTIL